MNHTNYIELYPELGDDDFNIKISNKKEFIDTHNKSHTKNIRTKSFTLKSHQLLVKNFLSRHTPYNNLLLFHGLGTGKTCSAIGIAFENIKYMINTNTKREIIVVCSPNVRDNFKKQIYEESKLVNNNNWILNTCIGDELLKYIDPFNNISSREKIKEKINSFIDEWFIFMGYTTLANSINDTSIKNILLDKFDNRLIIIDEIHNIRDEDKSNKIVPNKIVQLIEKSNNIKLLLLSATPMFDNYKEIIWLVNLMNLNDKRPLISFDDIFVQFGAFLKTDGPN